MNNQQVQNALGRMSRALTLVAQAELVLERAVAEEAKRREAVADAKASFNEVREELIGLCPELLTGFPMHKETVGVVNGKLAVVPED